MINKEKLGEPIGEGLEKEVFNDPNNPDRVIGIFRDHIKETPNQIKSRYYLTKILHLLFPENILDLHWAGSGPNAFQADKGEHSELHKTLHAGKESEPFSYKEAEKSLRSDPALDNFQEELEKLGVRSLDNSPLNYSHDSEGNIIYMDTFYVWRKNIHGELKLFCDFDKLENAINQLSSDDKIKAAKYLSRLRELFEEEGGKNPDNTKT